MGAQMILKIIFIIKQPKAIKYYKCTKHDPLLKIECSLPLKSYGWLPDNFCEATCILMIS